MPLPVLQFHHTWASKLDLSQHSSLTVSYICYNFSSQAAFSTINESFLKLYHLYIPYKANIKCKKERDACEAASDGVEEELMSCWLQVFSLTALSVHSFINSAQIFYLSADRDRCCLLWCESPEVALLTKAEKLISRLCCREQSPHLSAVIIHK